MDEKKQKRSESGEASKLRHRAEQRLRTKKIKPVETMADGDVRALVYELHVHQIELEMQNEELCIALAAARELPDKYCHLLDLLQGADIGITAVDPALNIVMANKKQAEIVGRSPNELVGKKCFREYEGWTRSARIVPGSKPWPAVFPPSLRGLGRERTAERLRYSSRLRRCSIRMASREDSSKLSRTLRSAGGQKSRCDEAKQCFNGPKKPLRRPTAPRASS